MRSKERFGISEGMVRVISCHHFISQDVFLAENEPVALCTAQEKLLIATVQHCVEVRDLDRRGHVLHTFPTVDQVKQLVYCEAANYVATLEKKSSRHSKPPINYVRAYLNWWVDMKGQPMRVRIAGSLTSSNQSGSGQLEMIELPLNEIALCIACCKHNGTLAISTGHLVQVFSFSKNKNHDFDHLIDIQLSFPAQEISLCEDYFACLSSNTVQVFQVVFETEQETGVGKNIKEQLSSEITDDPFFVEWKFDSFHDDGSIEPSYREILEEKLDPASFPVEIKMRSIERANSSNSTANLEPEEVLGPVGSSKTCNIEVSVDSRIEAWTSNGLIKAEAITLLFRRFGQGPDSETALHGLHLVPVYFADEAQPLVDPLSAAAAVESSPSSSISPLQSKIFSGLNAAGCFFTNAQEGFLYDVTSCGTQVELVSHYIYTALVKSVALESNLLHALTETGLETYTLRLPHRAFQHSGTKKVFPSSHDPICLVGLRPFFSVEQLVMSERHLILVSASDDSLSSTDSIDGSSSCTIYSLRKPDPIQLFQDIFEIGLLNCNLCPSTYLHLLLEGHMVLRSYLYAVGEHKCGKEALELFRESCALIGDHFSCSSDLLDLELAVSYFLLSEHPVENVFSRCKELKSQLKEKSILQCLVMFLEHKLLLESNPDTSLLPLSTTEAILEVFSDESPDKLWKIILLSNLTTYRSEKAMMLLKKRIASKKSTAGDTLAMVTLLLRKGNEEAAQNLMLSVSKEELVPVIVTVSSLLFVEQVFSHFGETIRRLRPDVFVESLLSLVQQKLFLPDQIIEIMMGSSSDPEPENVTLLKEFLESFLSDKKSNFMASKKSIMMLLKVYLKRLLLPPAKSSASRSTTMSLTKSASLFGVRDAWLGDLPPFSGRGIARSCQQRKIPIGEHCHCWHCNEDLLRLQSLLCSPLCQDNVKLEFKGALISLGNSGKGNLSLQVLCSDWKESVRLLLDGHPKGLLPFAGDTFENNQNKWCHVFEMIKTKLQNDPSDVQLQQLFNDVLGQLAEMLHPTALINLVPPGDRSETFLPHIKRCCEKHQATLLREKVIGIGMEVKAMM